MYVGVTVFISVRVERRDDDPIDVVCYVAFGDVFYQFVDHVKGYRWCNPFSSVDTSIRNDDWFAGIVSSC